jgi:hypothetical protein
MLGCWLDCRRWLSRCFISQARLPPLPPCHLQSYHIDLQSWPFFLNPQPLEVIHDGENSGKLLLLFDAQAMSGWEDSSG